MVQEGLLNGLGCGDPFFNRLGATVVERTFCSSGANARFILLWGCNVKCSRIFIFSKAYSTYADMAASTTRGTNINRQAYA
jgi:hypothetical protein